MAKTTVSGSFLAKHFPTLFQHFSQNASQEEFNKAEQEAAVAFQQHQGNGITEVPTPAATVVVPPVPAPAAGAVVPPVPAPVAEVVTTTVEATVTLADLQAQIGTLTDQKTAAEASLNTANTTIATLTPKAQAWDAHQAALKGVVSGDSTNKVTTTTKDTGLSAKDQTELEDKQRLAAKYPGLMADLGIPLAKQEE